MDRRSDKVSGLILFPTQSKRFINTLEGGMFVKLVVLPNKDYSKDPLSCCCGTVNTFEIAGECLINDDRNYLHVVEQDNPTQDNYLEFCKERNRRESKYYPFLHKEDDTDLESPSDRYISTQYLAVILLGSTGWSGYNEKTCKYWYCTPGDLTKEGKELYEGIKKLYKGYEIRLLTYLDT